MGRNKPQRPRPITAPTPGPKPQGEQQLSDDVWAQMVKAIRALSPA